ncbi:MAG TPA: serine O-acetyltransferase [Microscillaceae bacterium]|nr:serine O-acetyltransferase [Microscillaceae bacterium]
MNKERIWEQIKQEVTQIDEPVMHRLIQRYIHPAGSLGRSVILILAHKLADDIMDERALEQLLTQQMGQNNEVTNYFAADLEQYYTRDFACHTYLEALCFFRGFQALAAYRMAHQFYQQGKTLTAKWLQNRIFEKFAIDIHPAAVIAKGLVIDHGIGVVIGETCEVGENVFIFHNVTLGGTGKTQGDRHPKIGANVVIGAGATLLGNIKIGQGANIAAGAVVLREVPAYTTVAGIPAKVKGKANSVQ